MPPLISLKWFLMKYDLTSFFLVFFLVKIWKENGHESGVLSFFFMVFVRFCGNVCEGERERE